ncbi:MAG: ice-binding family protein [Acidimicrobiales bacterium]
MHLSPFSSFRRADAPSTVRLGAHRRRSASVGLMIASAVALVVAGAAFVPSASAAQAVQLGTATPFAVLAYSAVTDVPTSAITGDVGLSPAAGTNYAGLSQAEVTGTIYSTDGTGPAGTVDDPALLTTAKNDLSTAYTTAAGQPPTTTFTSGDNQLGGQTLVPGVYAFGAASTANLTGGSPLVLNGQGDANAVFVFQASSSLVTGSNSVVQLENGAQACNVFWQVGSSATLNSASTFVGTIMALTSATLDTGATVQGRVLAENGAVTLDANTITTPPTCALASTTTGTTTATGTGGTGGKISTTSGTTSGGEGASGTGSAAGAGGAVVPAGFPHTGFGGAAHSRDGVLIALGGLAMAGSMAAATVAGRRRRSRQRTAATSP